MVKSKGTGDQGAGRRTGWRTFYARWKDVIIFLIATSSFVGTVSGQVFDKLVSDGIESSRNEADHAEIKLLREDMNEQKEKQSRDDALLPRIEKTVEEIQKDVKELLKQNN